MILMTELVCFAHLHTATPTHAVTPGMRSCWCGVDRRSIRVPEFAVLLPRRFHHRRDRRPLLREAPEASLGAGDGDRHPQLRGHVACAGRDAELLGRARVQRSNGSVVGMHSAADHGTAGRADLPHGCRGDGEHEHAAVPIHRHR